MRFSIFPEWKSLNHTHCSITLQFFTPYILHLQNTYFSKVLAQKTKALSVEPEQWKDTPSTCIHTYYTVVTPLLQSLWLYHRPPREDSCCDFLDFFFLFCPPIRPMCKRKTQYQHIDHPGYFFFFKKEKTKHKYVTNIKPILRYYPR